MSIKVEKSKSLKVEKSKSRKVERSKGLKVEKSGDWGGVVDVRSAVEMLDAAGEGFAEADILVFAAAVADFRPANPVDHKIKEHKDGFDLRLVANPDIAFEFGKVKRENQVSVGFALETDDGLQAALEKKEKKNFDLIVLNSLQDQGAGFGGDTNRITIIGKDNKPVLFELKSKADVALDILDEISRFINRDSIYE